MFNFCVNRLYVLVSHLASLDKSLCNFPVSSSVACSNEISDATALQERCRRDRAGGAEQPSKADHLHETQSDHRSLRIVSETQPVTETCAHGHYVL